MATSQNISQKEFKKWIPSKKSHIFKKKLHFQKFNRCPVSQNYKKIYTPSYKIKSLILSKSRSNQGKKKFLHYLPNVVYRKRRHRPITPRERSKFLLKKLYFSNSIKRKKGWGVKTLRTYKRKAPLNIKLHTTKRVNWQRKSGRSKSLHRRTYYHRMRPRWKHNPSSSKLQLLSILRKQKWDLLSYKRKIRSQTLIVPQTLFGTPLDPNIASFFYYKNRLIGTTTKAIPGFKVKNINLKLPLLIHTKNFPTKLITQKPFILSNTIKSLSKNVSHNFSTWARMAPKKQAYVRPHTRSGQKKITLFRNKHNNRQQAAPSPLKKRPFTFKRWKWRFPRWKHFPRIKRSLPRIYWQTQDLFPYRLYRQPHQPYRQRKPWQQKKNIKLRLIRQKTKWGRLLRRSEFITLQRRYFQIYSNFYGPWPITNLRKQALHLRRSAYPRHSNLMGALTCFDHHLDIALCRLRLAPTIKIARLLINQGYIRINGLQTRNVHKRVHNWDLIQITLESDYFFGKYWYSRNKYQRYLYRQTKNRFKYTHPKKLILPFGFFTRSPRLSDLPRYDRVSWQEFGRLLLI